MTKRLSRKDLKREVADLSRAVDTLGEQFLAEQRKRKAAEENVEKAVDSGDAARNELTKLRRQLSEDRVAYEALQKDLYPEIKGFGWGGIYKSPGTVPGISPYTINVHNAGVDVRKAQETGRVRS